MFDIYQCASQLLQSLWSSKWGPEVIISDIFTSRIEHFAILSFPQNSTLMSLLKLSPFETFFCVHFSYYLAAVSLIWQAKRKILINLNKITIKVFFMCLCSHETSKSFETRSHSDYFWNIAKNGNNSSNYSPTTVKVKKASFFLIAVVLLEFTDLHNSLQSMTYRWQKSEMRTEFISTHW